MAHPQPERSDNDPAAGLVPASSLADARLPGASPNAVWLTICAWCDRIKVRGRWISDRRALAMVDESGSHAPNLTHGICPNCFVDVTAHANREREARERADAAKPPRNRTSRSGRRNRQPSRRGGGRA